MLRAAALLALVGSSAAMRLPSPPANARAFFEQAQTATTAVALSVLLVAQPHAAVGGVPEAAIEFTDAAYPIIGSLKKEAVAPLTGKAISAALTASPKEIINRSVDTGFWCPFGLNFVKVCKERERE